MYGVVNHWCCESLVYSAQCGPVSQSSSLHRLLLKLDCVPMCHNIFGAEGEDSSMAMHGRVGAFEDERKEWMSYMECLE